MRNRFTIPEPCMCGAEDCKECYPLSYRDNDNQPEDEPEDEHDHPRLDHELDDMPDVTL